MSESLTSTREAKQVLERLLVVGQRLPRVEARQQVTGEAKFAIDMSLPGMLWGRVLTSPYPQARILKIDTTQAERLPGVKAVVTAEDLPAGVTVAPFAEPPLATGKVHYVGDVVAGVAAITEDIAAEALGLIKVDYEEMPAVFDPEEALKPGVPLVHERNLANRFEVVRGDTEKGFREADFIAEDRFVTQPVTHCCLERNTCLASFDASDKLTVWSTSVAIFGARSALAAALAMPESKVRVIQPLVVGGHFGSRIHPPQSYFVCALLARKAGVPVKMVNTREEEFVATKRRMPIIIELKMGVKKDGTLVAKQTRVIGDQGAYLSPVGVPIMNTAATRHESLYRFSNIKTEGYLVFTNNAPSGPFRGFGNPQGHFALESMMDVLARGIGMDPMELRLKNATRAGDITVHGWDMQSCGLSECITRAAAKMGWKEKKASRKSGRGLGMACAIHVAGMKRAGQFVGATALVKVNDDGTVNLVSGSGEIGTGSVTVLSQICAEELGVRAEDVTVSAADTDLVPFAPAPISSRVTVETGNAVRLAAADAKTQLITAAAEKLKVASKDLVARDRKIYVPAQPEKGLSIAEAARAALLRQGPVLGRGVYVAAQPGTDPQTLYGDCASAYSFAADVAEVEVDTETGQVKVLGMASARDLGRAMNPLFAEGQIQGAAAQGLGYALTEQLVDEDGKMTNSSFTDYKIARSLDMPVLHPILVESNEPRGPFGGKGLGEIGLVPVAPAIANAIYDAVGVRLTELPFTAERVLQALKEKRQ